jgi:hypothetical protein
MAGGSKWPVFFCVNFTPIFHDNQPLIFYHRTDNEDNNVVDDEKGASLENLNGIDDK